MNGSSDCNVSPFSVSSFLCSAQSSRIQNIINVVMFSPLCKPCRTLIRATPECCWRSPARSLSSPGPVFSNHVCGTRFCPSRTTCANACHCSFNTQHFWVITAWFAAVRFRPVQPTLGVVMNTEGSRESWNLSCISVCSSLPISAYMWNISTWSAKNFVIHHFKWQTWSGRGQHSTAFCGGGAQGGELSCLCSGNSVSLDASSWSASGYTAGSLTRIGNDVSLSHLKIGGSTQVSSGHSSCHCPESSLRSSVTPNTAEKHASRQLWTLHAREAPREVYLCTTIFRCACTSSVHSRSMRCAFS